MPESARTQGEELLEIDIERIAPNVEQPRTRFTADALEELAQSIRENGVIQPIVVRRKDNRYEIVAGERRWRAAQIVGLQKIPAVVREVTDDKLLELALIENIQRQELNSVEEARAYKKLIDSLGLTQEMVAQRVGKDRTFITNYLRLLKLPDDVLKLLEEEKITVGHARALLGLENAGLQRRLAHSIVDTSMNVRETERSVKRVLENPNQNGSLRNALKETKADANHKAAEDKLRRQLNTKVRITRDIKGTGGKIEIEYYDEETLNRVYNLLMATANRSRTASFE